MCLYYVSVAVLPLGVVFLKQKTFGIFLQATSPPAPVIARRSPPLGVVFPTGRSVSLRPHTRKRPASVTACRCAPAGHSVLQNKITFGVCLQTTSPRLRSPDREHPPNARTLSP